MKCQVSGIFVQLGNSNSSHVSGYLAAGWKEAVTHICEEFGLEALLQFADPFFGSPILFWKFLSSEVLNISIFRWQYPSIWWHPDSDSELPAEGTLWNPRW